MSQLMIAGIIYGPLGKIAAREDMAARDAAKRRAALALNLAPHLAAADMGERHAD